MVDEQAGLSTPSDDAPAPDAPASDVPTEEPASDVPTEEPASDVPTEEPIETIEQFDVIYSCLRCATHVSAVELERLPEIKCICGFRVFVKNRPPIVKSVNAV